MDSAGLVVDVASGDELLTGTAILCSRLRPLSHIAHRSASGGTEEYTHRLLETPP